MSDSRHRILTAITTHQEAHGWPPSQRELSALVGLSVSTVNHHLDGLDRDGYIRRGIGPRQIRVLRRSA